MARMRSFSIYLLKTGITAGNALNSDTQLARCAEATSLPTGGVMYILDSAPTPPWWRGYFGVTQELTQSHKSAIVFLPIGDRWFALTFGHVMHNLKDTAFEYDFGLRVTLNCVDPQKLRSTDTLEPGVSRRQRTQLPTGSDLTFFDIDKDSSILRGLTGKVKAEYAEYFKQATGSSSLQISTDAGPAGLAGVCEKLLELYGRDDYRATFPDIRAIEPVKDPEVVTRLEARLLLALRSKEAALTLTVPDLINFREGLFCSFGGGGRSPLLYDDVAMPHYYEYLEQRNLDLANIDIPTLKRHELYLCNEEGESRDSFTVHKCMLFDVELDAAGPSYHLCDGHWYVVARDYVVKLREELDPYFEPTTLMAYNHDGEGAYNDAVGAASVEHICLDRTSVAPEGQTAIEPCDLYSIDGGAAVHTHVKISTRSQELSHLFNQGANAIEVLLSESEARAKLETLIRERLGGRDERAFLAPIETANHRVVYAIATRKPSDRKSNNLPLFSRMSLRRCIRVLKLMRVPVKCCYIADARGLGTGRARRRPAGPLTVEAAVIAPVAPHGPATAVQVV